ncbi:MAG: potassium transporter TrkG [Planctomycetota bacterium]
MREASYLLQRYRAMGSYLGLVVALVGTLMLCPLLTLLAWPAESEVVWPFLGTGLIAVVIGLASWKLLRAKNDVVVLTIQEGGVIVLLSWLTAFGLAAIPLAILEDLSSTQALFESVSGWTTTGLSVVDVTRAHPATLLWRSVMQLAGGAGFAILMLAALTGQTGPSLSAAEGRSDQLVPNVRASARLVLRIYTGFVAFGVLALRAAGMGWFDAINHAFCALSTGGFSTRVTSIGYFDSAAIEAVTIVLMLLGNLNFITAWCLLRGSFRAVTRNGEIRLVAVLVPICGGLLLWLTCAPLYSSLSRASRVAIFETVTALTTTGYSTVGYGDWNSFGVLILLLLVLIGGATCGTAGGIKQFRIYLLFRGLVRELRRPFLPRTSVVDDSTYEGEERVPLTDARLRTIGVFVFLYLGVWLCGAAVLAAWGFTLRDSLFELASALGTVGLSVGVTAPDAPWPVLWTEMVAMFLGRLEFFVIIASAAKLVRDGVVLGRSSRRAQRPGNS